MTEYLISFHWFSLYFTVKKCGGSKKGKKVIKQEKVPLQELTADICLISLDAQGKAFYLNTSTVNANDVCIIKKKEVKPVTHAVYSHSSNTAISIL